MSGADLNGVTHAYADVNGVRLHYAEAGSGPLVLLLHGFPEFWYAWRRQIPALAFAGFRVVAPDMRGYGLSSKPPGRRSYSTDRLAGDVAGLIRHLGAERAHVVGHDWGGVVAYTAAMEHPEVLDRLVILNVPHPTRMLEGLRTLRQLRKSWYIFAFQLPRLPEAAIRRGNFAVFKEGFRDEAPGAFSDRDIELYEQAWEQHGAIAGMVNYYRASVRQSPRKSQQRLRPISAPTLVIWGERDKHLGAELAEPDRKWVPDLRVERLPEASHWVEHDAPDRVNELLTEFLQS
jgi:pimeloyl-ACP methyl ester carboxylesterase